MKTLKIALLLFIAATGVQQQAMAQVNRPSIKANSPKVSVKIDGKLWEARWNIEPQIQPDVFKTSAKEVVFYTDIDSISLRVDPNNPVDFNIVLNGRNAWTQVLYEPSRLAQLKHAAAYDAEDKQPIPAFTYQDKSSPELVALRETYKLDSIAGSGSEVSQFIHLMNWVHHQIRHDGHSENPTIKNTNALFQICLDENRGVNCRMLAMILNECYLAMGFKSRYITCMPKELKFDDCHVINMVYSETLKKWLWMDPTNNAYVMDETGMLLSVAEVRERLINDKTLILNPDANWNRKYSLTKADYLDQYMAKNLYRIEAPVYSQYNAETWATQQEVQYVQLVPMDAINQSPKKKVQTNPNTKVSFTNFLTNNPAIFWAQP
ncbi:transglutaminase domain-containing protein [Sphingobacterium sp. Mn56C]|uniref:transglutaminase domain-containing protein n=1 Tax=Sphingobacterium sp. Mn56C TaxID=3395261 RepID=UPI003BD726C7